MLTRALATGVQPDEILPAILPALIALLVLVVVGTIVLAILRRSMKPTANDPTEGFTLHGLRQMHARGELTDEELERAKAAVIERARGGGASGNSDDTAESSDTTLPDGPRGRGADDKADDAPESPHNL